MNHSAWLESQGVLGLERQGREHQGWGVTGGSSVRLPHLQAKPALGRGGPVDGSGNMPSFS